MELTFPGKTLFKSTCARYLLGRVVVAAGGIFQGKMRFFCLFSFFIAQILSWDSTDKCTIHTHTHTHTLSLSHPPPVPHCSTPTVAPPGAKSLPVLANDCSLPPPPTHTHTHAHTLTHARTHARTDARILNHLFFV